MAEQQQIPPQRGCVILSLEDEFAPTEPTNYSPVIHTTMEKIHSLCSDEMPAMAAYIRSTHEFYMEPLKARQALLFMAAAQQQQPLTTDTHLLILMSGEVMSSDTIIGFILFGIGRGTGTDDGSLVLNISQCFVCKPERRQKLATLMLDQLITAYGKQLTHIKADVPQREDALSFFMGRGFELRPRELTASLKQCVISMRDETEKKFVHDGGLGVENRDCSLRLYYYPSHCHQCKKTNVKTHRCKGCYRVYYCNEQCQKIDRRMHGRVCGK